MKKPPYNRPPTGIWRDAGDETVRSAYYDPKEFRGTRTNKVVASRQRKKPADSEDLLIKIVAAVLLIALLLGISAYFKEQRNLRALTIAAQAQERSRILGERAALFQAPPGQQSTVQSQSRAPNERQLYRCVDQNGSVSIQDNPCPSASTPTWGQVIPGDNPGQASLRQQQWNRQQAEARLRQEEARFAAATGTGNQSQTLYPTQLGDLDQRRIRCQAQKDYRDAVLRQVGLNRTFDLIRQLNDQVYEACKGL